jgi:hypothetical protein
VPPTAAPPSKKPILTLLKQGRAFGVGLVLATQNPVDLDYKAMANAGAWFVGRLQTENDKARVLEALRSAAGGMDIASLDKAVGALQKRQFLLIAAKASAPTLFATRWAMSYLRGPLTKEEIGRLTAVASPVAAAASEPAPAPASPIADDESVVAPPLAEGISSSYLDPAALWASEVGATASGARLRAFLASRVAVRYDDTALGLDEREELELVVPLDEELDLDRAITVDYDVRDLTGSAPVGASFVLPDPPVAEARFWRDAGREIKQHMVDSRPLELLRNRQLKLASRPGENRAEFETRCDQAAQAAADAEAAKIRDRLELKRDRLENALTEAQRRVEQLDTDAKTRHMSEVVSGAGAVLGALLGGRHGTRSITGALSGAASRRGMSSRTVARREAAEEKAVDVQDDLALLEQEILDEVAEIDERWRAAADDIESVAVRAEATDVQILETRLVWVPTD